MEMRYQVWSWRCRTDCACAKITFGCAQQITLGWWSKNCGFAAVQQENSNAAPPPPHLARGTTQPLELRFNSFHARDDGCSFILHNYHRRMPNFIFSDDRTRAAIAYILSLER